MTTTPLCAPTFQQQYQKIVSAYYKNELRPMNDCACFIGNLLNNKNAWSGVRTSRFGERLFSLNSGIAYELACEFIDRESRSLYSPEDIVAMENNFLNICYPIGAIKRTEETLFLAMQSTLEMLRKIHEAKGEIIYGYDFKQRQLCEK